jgi:hypothetical protein
MTLPLFWFNEPPCLWRRAPCMERAKTIEDLLSAFDKRPLRRLQRCLWNVTFIIEDAQATYRLAGNHVPLAIYMNERFPPHGMNASHYTSQVLTLPWNGCRVLRVKWARFMEDTTGTVSTFAHSQSLVILDFGHPSFSSRLSCSPLTLFASYCRRRPTPGVLFSTRKISTRVLNSILGKPPQRHQ